MDEKINHKIYSSQKKAEKKKKRGNEQMGQIEDKKR